MTPKTLEYKEDDIASTKDESTKDESTNATPSLKQQWRILKITVREETMGDKEGTINIITEPRFNPSEPVLTEFISEQPVTRTKGVAMLRSKGDKPRVESMVMPSTKAKVKQRHRKQKDIYCKIRTCHKVSSSCQRCEEITLDVSTSCIQ